MTKKNDKKPAKATAKSKPRTAPGSKSEPKTPAKTASRGSSKPSAKPAPKATPKAAPAKAASSKSAPKAAVPKSGGPKTPPPVLVPKPKPVTRADALFKVGDHVVYPFHGVGVIHSIEKINITGEDAWYYNLDFGNGALTIKLPVAQQSEKGMRKVIGRTEVEKVMVVLKKKPPSEESDWKVRHNAYLEDLKSGDIYKAAKVARNLSKRGPEGELSMSEKRLLEAAVQQLVQEIAEASREPIEKVETEISKCLRAGRV